MQLSKFVNRYRDRFVTSDEIRKVFVLLLFCSNLQEQYMYVILLTDQRVQLLKFYYETKLNYKDHVTHKGWHLHLLSRVWGASAH